MRVIRDSEGLDYKLRFLHNGTWAHECVVSPHNVDKKITQVWNNLGNNEVLYEEVPIARIKAIRFPGRRY